MRGAYNTSESMGPKVVSIIGPDKMPDCLKTMSARDLKRLGDLCITKEDEEWRLHLQPSSVPSFVNDQHSTLPQ